MLRLKKVKMTHDRRKKSHALFFHHGAHRDRREQINFFLCELCELCGKDFCRMKLPRLQLHLSTCIVLMFVAGGLIWANVPQKRDVPLQVKTESELIAYFAQGWPYSFRILEFVNPDVTEGYYDTRLEYAPLARNICIALAILAATAILCEWLLRRRPI